MNESHGKFKFRRYRSGMHAVVALAALVCGAYTAGALAAIGEGPQSAGQIEALVPVAPTYLHDMKSAQGGTGWQLRREPASQSTNPSDILQPQTGAQIFLVPKPDEGGPGWKPLTAVEVPQGGPGWIAPDMLANLSGATLPTGQSELGHHWQIAPEDPELIAE